MSELQRQVGQRIRQLREKRGWSQEGFADECGLHRTYIGSVERGERNLTLSSLQTIAKTLNVSMSELLKGIG
ncbi:MAG: helix-turn-helix transcriptional regulator [Acidobacteria bacterium]|nr:helix-turn-helix transcriptional regulator [Acidobacteriota bacterium]